MQPIHAEKYFETLFGFREKNYEATKRVFLSMCSFESRRGRERCLFALPPSADAAAQQQQQRQRSQLSSGWHYTPSVRELRKEARDAIDAFEAKYPGYLAKVRAQYAEKRVPTDLDPATTPFTQVASLRMAHVLGVSRLQHLQFPGALFQAASQFNLLEFLSPTVIPEAGVADYVFDATQGPDCAVACFAGTAYRNYLLHPELVHDGELAAYQSDVLCRTEHGAKPRVPLSAEQLNAKRGQRKDCQMDTLQDVTRFLTGMRGGKQGHDDVPGIPYNSFYRIQNGYFHAMGDAVSGLVDRVKLLADFFETSVPSVLDEMSDRLRIGVVEDATVTCGLLHPEIADGVAGQVTDCASTKKHYAPHTVWQTYNSALSLSSGRHDEQSSIPLLAKCVLNGSYEATLLVGVQRTLQYLDATCAETGDDSNVPPTLPPVFLTKVGGGVFNNEPAWILSAIERAMDRVSSCGVPLDLRLVHFRHLDSQYLSSEH